MGYRSTPAQLQPRATWSAPCKYHHSTIKSTAGSTYRGTPAKTARADLPTGRQFNTAVSFLEQRFLMEIIEANPSPDGKSRYYLQNEGCILNRRLIAGDNCVSFRPNLYPSSFSPVRMRAEGISHQALESRYFISEITNRLPSDRVCPKSRSNHASLLCNTPISK